MKNQIKFLTLLIALLALTFNSCEEEDVSELFQEDSGIVINDIALEREKVTDEKILNLIDQLQIDVGTVTQGDFYLPDGTVENRIYIGEDLVFTVEELEQMSSVDSLNQNRQYRTLNLVTGANQSIDILGYTGNQFALSSKAQAALQQAVINYNSINNMSLNFTLTFGTNFNAADIVIYDTSLINDNSGGTAGFPSNQGLPHKFIQIYNLEGYSTGVNEHVITHEIGHSVGFRHTDWFSRQSCGLNVNEGDNGVGVIHINGTPIGFDSTSVMLACFNNFETGNFNNNDIRALKEMYPEGTISNDRFALYRYFRSGNHFYTTNFNELGNGANGHTFEGIQAYVYTSNASGRIPLYRYYNSSVNNHFYTTDFSHLGIGAGGYVLEGVIAYVHASAGDGRVPLYRYYNASIVDHFYTTNFNELGNGAGGYVLESIQAYVYTTP